MHYDNIDDNDDDDDSEVADQKYEMTYGMKSMVKRSNYSPPQAPISAELRRPNSQQYQKV